MPLVRPIAERILHKVKVKAMEGFVALTLRCFVTGTLLADGDLKGQVLGSIVGERT